MQPDLVDSHCHIDVAAFHPDRDAVLARARRAGVRRIVVPAIAAAGWDTLEAICRRHPGLFPAYGLHPMFLGQHRRQHLDALAGRLDGPGVVAVGECGLDHFVPELDRTLQLRFFEAQLQLARDTGLPVIVHARRAVDEVTAAIRRVGGLRGVVHSFSGSQQQARTLWDLGFLVGLGGPVTWPRAQRLRRLAASMPLEFLLLETDAPDQPGAGHRGERNEPAHLPAVLEVIAGLRGEDPVAVARATTANAERLFGGLAAAAPAPTPPGAP